MIPSSSNLNPVMNALRKNSPKPFRKRVRLGGAISPGGEFVLIQPAKELALYHSHGKLPEPELPRDFF